MPDIQDTINLPERIMEEQYEMYVLYVDDEEGELRKKGAVVIQADALIEETGAGIAKLRLTNVIVDPMNRIRIIGKDARPTKKDTETERKEFTRLMGMSRSSEEADE